MPSTLDEPHAMAHRLQPKIATIQKVISFLTIGSLASASVPTIMVAAAPRGKSSL
jgi:hypothetical protein